MKKWMAYGILAIMAILAVFLRKYQERQDGRSSPRTATEQPVSLDRNNLERFRDPKSEYFFTKHARCRMDCRSITQKEVKEIVQLAKVNYNKSDLHASQGPKYAVEGFTRRDGQHIRVIVAPKKSHLSIVTVIDLDREWACPSCN